MEAGLGHGGPAGTQHRDRGRADRDVAEPRVRTGQAGFVGRLPGLKIGMKDSDLFPGSLATMQRIYVGEREQGCQE